MESKVTPGVVPPPLAGTDAISGKQVDVAGLAREGPVVVVFSRYFGCPVCQHDFDKLVAAQDAILAKATLVYVTQSSPDTAKAFVASRDVRFPVLCDPAGPYPLYQAWGVGNVSLVTFAKMGKVVLSGKYKHGDYEGNEKQSPADFVIAGGKIAHANYSLLDVGKLLAALP